MNVKIRQDGDSFLAFFPESGRMMEVNQTDANVLDWLLNQNMSGSEVISEFAKTYQLDPAQAEADIKEFVDKVAQQLEPTVFNLVDQRQFRAPIGVELEINTGCNLRCAHCFQAHHDDHCMSIDQIKNILAELARAGIFEISIIGGEPFYHPNIDQVLRLSSEHGFKTSVTTNGTLTDSHLDVIVETGTSVFVSLDGVGQVHDSIRGKGVFRQVDQTIHKMVDMGIPVDAICTLNATNADTYLEVVEYCQGLNIPCNFNLFKPFREHHAMLTLNPEKYFQIVLNLYEMRLEGKRVGVSNAAIVSVLSGLAVLKECTATLTGLVISSHGEMVSCPGLVAAGYYNGINLPMFDTNFLETWRNHPVFVQFRENGLSGCQVRSFLFCHDAQGKDPYGIDAFLEFQKQH